jgi:hypothetical protein
MPHKTYEIRLVKSYTISAECENDAIAHARRQANEEIIDGTATDMNGHFVGRYFETESRKLE